MPIEWLRRTRGLRTTSQLRLMWRVLPWRARLNLLGAVGLTFAVVGVVMDLLNLDNRLPWRQVVGYAAMTGVMSVVLLVAALRHRALIAVGVLAQFVGVFAIRRLLGGGPVALPAGMSEAAWMAQRAARDGFACLGLTVAGYTLFVRFITSQGVQSVRWRTEMALARDIHDSLVPPVALRIGPVEAFGASVPSSEVGGDLADVVVMRDGVLALIADVSGHGVAAGTLMAMVRAAVRTQVASVAGRDAATAPLGDVLATVNRVLLDLGRPDRFVTVAALHLRADGAGEVALAGHLPVLRVRDGAIERFDNEHLPLGVRDGERFAARPVTARPGDLFVLYTDGMTEIADAAGRQLGIEALEAALLARPEAPLADIYRALMERVKAHGVPSDDMTLLLVRLDRGHDAARAPQAARTEEPDATGTIPV